MSKPINEPRMVQQALVSDEDLSFELAAFGADRERDHERRIHVYRQGHQIVAVRQDHAYKRAAYGRHVGHRDRPADRQGGVAVSKLLRNPVASADVIAGLRLAAKDEQHA